MARGSAGVISPLHQLVTAGASQLASAAQMAELASATSSYRCLHVHVLFVQTCHFLACQRRKDDGLEGRSARELAAKKLDEAAAMP
jgi:hypothetical protein